MRLYSEIECVEVLKDWALKLLTAVEAKTGQPIKQLPPSFEFEGKTLQPEFLIEVGECLIYLASAPINLKLFNPVLVVSEKKRRKHKPGIGHSKTYYALDPTGYPNFEAAVDNAVRRDNEIKLATEEGKTAFKDYPLPNNVVAVPLKSGNVAVHVLSTEMSLHKFVQLCNVLRS